MNEIQITILLEKLQIAADVLITNAEKLDENLKGEYDIALQSIGLCQCYIMGIKNELEKIK